MIQFLTKLHTVLSTNNNYTIFKNKEIQSETRLLNRPYFFLHFYRWYFALLSLTEYTTNS